MRWPSTPLPRTPLRHPRNLGNSHPSGPLPLTVYPTVVEQAPAGTTSSSQFPYQPETDSWPQPLSLLPLCLAEYLGMAPNSASVPQPSPSKLFSVTEIEPWLYLSGASVLGARLLEDLSITCVVSACPELPALPLPDSVKLHHRIDLRDTPTADIAPHLAAVADIIAKVAENGGRTLVHCVAGVSRSASLCLAYLVRDRGLSLEAAYLRLLDLRPCIRPNLGFFRQLIDFEQAHRGGEGTVRIAWNEAAKAEIPNVYESDYVNTVRYIHRGVGIK